MDYPAFLSYHIKQGLPDNSLTIDFQKYAEGGFFNFKEVFLNCLWVLIKIFFLSNRLYAAVAN
jgi:hypothetical protein